MFEKIVLRRSESGPPVSVGELAEALLYYQNVHMILDYSSLFGLVQVIGMPLLLELLNRPNVSAVYCHESLGTHTETVGGMQYHSFIAFSLGAGPPNFAKVVEEVLVRNGHTKKDAGKLTEKFCRKVPFKKLESNYFLPGGITKAATKDIFETEFAHNAVKEILKSTYGAEDQSGNVRFHVVSSVNSFLVSTSIDVDKINSLRLASNTSMEAVTIAHLINEILMARADMAFASHYGGDFRTSDVGSNIVRLRCDELLHRAGMNLRELNQFQEIVLPNSPSLKEVINGKEKTFEDFLVLLDKADRFHKWIGGINPDVAVVSSYLEEVVSEGWVNKLPSKILRYVIGGVAGAIANPLVGLGVAAADTFLLDKLIGGWKPSHFIDKQLKPFVAGR